MARPCPAVPCQRQGTPGHEREGAREGFGRKQRNVRDVALVAAAENDLQARVSIQSFDWRTLAQAKKRAPAIRNAFTTLPFYSFDPDDKSIANDSEGAAALRAASARGADFFGGFDWRDQEGATFDERVLRAIAAGPADGWFSWHGDIDETTAQLAKELGLTISAWTVDMPDDMKRLTDLQIDAILTDRLDRLNGL